MASGSKDQPSGRPKERRGKAKKKPLRLAINLSNCKYEVVRKVQRTLGWKEVGDENEWHVYWTDTSIGADRLLRLEPYQKINHFFGMLEVCRKKALSRNFAAMKKLAPAEYNFMPQSFILPRELPEFLAQFNSKSTKTFILKPDSGCQGRGIALVQTESGVYDAIRNLPTETLVAQKYLAKPMLVNDYKFDLRIYVLVLSCDPLRVFLYKEGLARFCTEKYVAPQRNNLGQACMHLTNYAVNKRNEKFAFNKDAAAADEGSKWSLTAMLEALRKKGHDVDTLWEQIADMTCKTLISIQPLLAHNYRTCIPDVRDPFSCFELLGLDVILDHNCKPWLLEVNHSPSFTTDTPLDRQIKEALILETLRLVHVDHQKIQKYQEGEKEGALSRLYSRRRSSAKENEVSNTGPKSSGRKTWGSNVSDSKGGKKDSGLVSGSESVKKAPKEGSELVRRETEERLAGVNQELQTVQDDSVYIREGVEGSESVKIFSKSVGDEIGLENGVSEGSENGTEGLECHGPALNRVKETSDLVEADQRHDSTDLEGSEIGLESVREGLESVGGEGCDADAAAAARAEELERLLESRRAHEEKTMVMYERILPSPDPILSARYRKLQESAEAVFQEHLEVKVRKRIAQVLEERRQAEQEERERASKPVRKTVEQLKKLLKPRGLVRKPDPRLERPTYRFSQVDLGVDPGERHVELGEWLADSARASSRGAPEEALQAKDDVSLGSGDDVSAWLRTSGSDTRDGRTVSDSAKGTKYADVAREERGYVSRPKPFRLSLPTLRADIDVSSCKVGGQGMGRLGDEDTWRPSLSELVLASTERISRNEKATTNVEWEPRGRRKRASGSSRVHPVGLQLGLEVVSVANQVALMAKGLKLSNPMPTAFRRRSYL